MHKINCFFYLFHYQAEKFSAFFHTHTRICERDRKEQVDWAINLICVCIVNHAMGKEKYNLHIIFLIQLKNFSLNIVLHIFNFVF